MKKMWIPFAWMVTVAFLFSLGCSTHVAKADGTVLAEYQLNGKQKITLDELEQEISELPTYKQRKYADMKGKQEYLELMAESRLILEEAKQRKLDEDQEILKKVEEYLHQLMVEKITEVEVDQKVKQVTEADMLAYYEAHLEDYVETEKIRLTCIMSEEDEEQANEWYKLVEGGKDILELAKELGAKGELKGPGERSEGDTGFFDRNAFSVAPDFTKAAFALEVGQTYAGVFPIDVSGTNYYAIFRNEEHQDERQKEFDEEAVQKDIRRKLEKENKTTRMTDWVEDVRGSAKLKLYTERIPADEVEAEGSDTKGSEMKGSEDKGSETKGSEAKTEAAGSETKGSTEK